MQVHVKTLAEALLPHFAPRLAARAESVEGVAALGVEFAIALLRGNTDGSSEGGLSEQVCNNCNLRALHACTCTCVSAGLSSRHALRKLQMLASVECERIETFKTFLELKDAR